MKIDFSNDKIGSEKTIISKRESLENKHSNQSEEFKEYLDASSKENLYLRYGTLIEFILATKKEKLNKLSEIIGFSEVTKARDTLRKIVGELSRNIKRGDFLSKIGEQQAKIIEQLDCNVTSDTHFVKEANQLIEPLKLEREITGFADVDSVLKLIGKPGDSQATENQLFYERVSDYRTHFSTSLDVIEEEYKKYAEQFQEIVNNIEKLNKILLERLLNEGVKIIKDKVITEDNCPLCLQPKNRIELLKELEIRVKELQEYKKEKQKLDEIRQTLEKELRIPIRKLNDFLSEKYLDQEENRELKEKIEILKLGLEAYSTQLRIEISSRSKVKAPGEIAIDRKTPEKITAFCKQKIDKLKAARENDPTFTIFRRLTLAHAAYLEKIRLEKEKEKLERRKRSLELVYSAFLETQKQALDSFLSRFSKDINDMYQFMNPGEKVEDIKLVPIEIDDELQGITMEFRFFKNSESPPQKYLSESHLNCLGIAFFLTSVKAFNKKNKFFILDDVISSFDTTHRKRFADLLVEKFSDYQIILLTHERNWFEIMRYLVKGKNWKVNTLKWHNRRGTYIDEPIKTLKEKIESKIDAGETDGLGNDIRKYLEHILKEIAYNLEVKLKFLFNDRNENRMSEELYSALKNHIKKHCIGLQINPNLNIPNTSLFIGNKESHDSRLFDASINDIIAFWSEIQDFESLFFCDSCDTYISLKNMGDKDKNIKCRCGGKIYQWKK